MVSNFRFICSFSFFYLYSDTLSYESSKLLFDYYNKKQHQQTQQEKKIRKKERKKVSFKFQKTYYIFFLCLNLGTSFLSLTIRLHKTIPFHNRYIFLILFHLSTSSHHRLHTDFVFLLPRQ